MIDRFEGAGAVITGGASGIGYATAESLGRRGANVVLADVEAAALARACDQLRAIGVDAHGVVCDVRDRHQVQSMADGAFDHLGRVDVLFNNAGVGVGGPIVTMSHDDWRWVVDVNLWGPIHGVESFLPRMIEQRTPGHVVFTASFAGLVPNVGLGSYCVTKYGVVALAEVLAKEMRQHGIGVSVLCPMRVATNIATSERNRQLDYGGPKVSPRIPDQDEDNGELAGRVIPVGEVAERVIEAIVTNALYIVTHEESRDPVRRRFQRIEQAYATLADRQRARGES